MGAVFAGDARAQLIEASVGPEPGAAEIHVSARDDSSSLLPISQRQNALFPGTAEAGTTTIRVVRLAEALPAAVKQPMPMEVAPCVVWAWPS